MDEIQWDLSNKFRSHWIKVNFYKEDPKLKHIPTLKDVRFCEATRKAMFQPVLLDRNSISCPGAQYSFGWNSRFSLQGPDSCFDKLPLKQEKIKSMLSQAVRFEEPIKYVGLNMEGDPDLVMSYLSAEQAMQLLFMFHDHTGKNLNTSISSMMSICSGVAVKAYLKREVSLSFGCHDSRKYADIGRENLAIGIPKNLLNIFIDFKQKDIQKKEKSEELIVGEELHAKC